jgi:hypothetical protein
MKPPPTPTPTPQPAYLQIQVRSPQMPQVKQVRITINQLQRFLLVAHAHV